MHIARQFLLYFVLSILVVLFKPFLHGLLLYIDIAYTYVNVQLGSLFNQSDIAIRVHTILTLALLPLVCSGIPALIYRAIKGKLMPYFIEVTWILWFILILSKLLI